MKVRLKEWNTAGYHFTLDWLLRSVNTVLTGEAKFQHLPEKSATEVQDALARTTKYICGPSRPLHRVEPRRSVLSGAVPAYPHGRSQGLGKRTGAQGEPARQDESPGGAPHFPEGAALQLQVQAPGSQRPRELLLPDEGHEPGDKRPSAGGVLPEVRGTAPRRPGVAVDPDGPGTLEGDTVLGLPRSQEGCGSSSSAAESVSAAARQEAIGSVTAW